MTSDLKKWRAETPGCENVLHFNNAGASLMATPVIQSIKKHFELEIMGGSYEAGSLDAGLIETFYPAAAKLINAKPSEIAFIENATRSWDMVFYGLHFKPGDRIITAEAEYASNFIAFLQTKKKAGIEIDVIPNDEYGQLSISELEKKISNKTKLIAITHVPTQGGLVNPVQEVGKIARQAGIFYLLDATQSIGQMPVDVKKIGCDALCATGRKFLRGPRGTGFLFVNEKVLDRIEPPFLDLHAATWDQRDHYTMMPDAKRFETWETNYASKIGLTTAINYALHIGLDVIYQRIKKLSKLLREKLSEIPSILLQDLGQEKCGIVTFIHKTSPAETIAKRLREKKINTSVSIEEYARLDLEKRGLKSLVRASVHYYNTEEEVDRFVNVLKEF